MGKAKSKIEIRNKKASFDRSNTSFLRTIPLE